jgi:SAM-dependent methyltransferase
MTHPPGFFQATEMPTAGWWAALFPDPTGIVASVGVEPGMTVVDLCSGDGWFTLPMARMARYVFAIDIEAAMLDKARDRLAASGVGNVALIEGDALDIARLVPEPADFVFMANVFHGVPDGALLGREVGKVLAPGGRFAILNWHRRPREETQVLGEPRGPKSELRLSPEETALRVTAGGLALAEIVDVPPYHYGAIFKLG